VRKIRVILGTEFRKVDIDQASERDLLGSSMPRAMDEGMVQPIEQTDVAIDLIKPAPSP
jgi:hypothetical protein